MPSKFNKIDLTKYNPAVAQGIKTLMSNYVKKPPKNSGFVLYVFDSKGVHASVSLSLNPLQQYHFIGHLEREIHIMKAQLLKKALEDFRKNTSLFIDG